MAIHEVGDRVQRARMADLIQAIGSMRAGSPSQYVLVRSLRKVADQLGWLGFSGLVRQFQTVLSARPGSITVQTYCAALQDAIGCAPTDSVISAHISQRLYG